MKFTYELAQRLRDECFTEDERRLLSTVEGSTVIDVADQLMMVYGSYEIKTDENTFLKNFAIIKFREGRHILQQLELLYQKIDELLDPEENIERETEVANDDGSGVREMDRTINDVNSTGTIGYVFDESATDNQTALINRSANTQTSQKDLDFNKKWKKDAFLNVKQRLVGKKTIDVDKLLQKDKSLEVKEAHYEVIPEEQEEVDNVLGKEIFSTITSQITGETGNVYNADNQEGFSLTRTDKTNILDNKEYSSETSSKFRNTTRKVQNEANLKSLRLQIPNIQSKFFTIFIILFKLEY